MGHEHKRGSSEVQVIVPVAGARARLQLAYDATSFTFLFSSTSFYSVGGVKSAACVLIICKRVNTLMTDFWLLGSSIKI